MQRSLREMKDYTVEATDGDIGKVTGFLFDDQNWKVRYLSVNVGSWLAHKEILLSPAAIEEPRELTVPLNISTQKVKESPVINLEEPVSREKEKQLHAYYGWPLYWGGTLEGGMNPFPVAPEAYEQVKEELSEKQEESENNNHLRSTREVIGYSIKAKDGEIGHVEDLIVSTDIWKIRYIVIDTKNLFPGKKVIIPAEWTTGISWEEHGVYVETSQEKVENSPEFNPSKPVNRAYEEVLFDYYGRPRYWVRDL